MCVCMVCMYMYGICVSVCTHVCTPARIHRTLYMYGAQRPPCVHQFETDFLLWDRVSLQTWSKTSGQQTPAILLSLVTPRAVVIGICNHTPLSMWASGIWTQVFMLVMISPTITHLSIFPAQLHWLRKSMEYKWMSWGESRGDHNSVRMKIHTKVACKHGLSLLKRDVACSLDFHCWEGN